MYRGRRLRRNQAIRSLIQETRLHPSDFIYPLFVCEGEGICEEITSMPDVYRYSVDQLATILDAMQEEDICACILFGIPKQKDAIASSAYDEEGVVQQAIRFIHTYMPEMYVIADVCMCEYTDHGHCGILDQAYAVDNDKTLKVLNKIAISYAKAGVDMLAPSDMMDGHIASLRTCLDAHGYTQLPIMGYSAKSASAFYGPFRCAADSAPSFGDRKSYQMDYANGAQALLEIQADISEGVDIVMVKPAMCYLDIVKEAHQRFDVPIAVYNVSGEYSMLKMAVQQGIMREEVIYESLLAMKRAGASIIITYFAIEIANKLKAGVY